MWCSGKKTHSHLDMPNISSSFSPHLDILTFPLYTLESMNRRDGHLAKDLLDPGCLGDKFPLPFYLIPQNNLVYLSGSYITGVQSIMDMLIQFIFTVILFQWDKPVQICRFQCIPSTRRKAAFLPL